MATTQPSAAFLPAIDAERSGSAGGYSNGSGGPGGQVDVGGEARLLGSGSRPSLKQFPRRGARNVGPRAARASVRSIAVSCVCTVSR